MVLSACRHMFVRPVVSMTLAVWIDAHVAAFEFFGGVPARLVPDNLKTGVPKPDLYDPNLNRAYAELAQHYGCLIDPARAGKPKDKPRVERPMPYVRDSFFAGRDWDSLAGMQDAALVWCTQVAGRIGRWAAPSRWRSSRPRRPRRCCRCRWARLSWLSGLPRRLLLTAT
jgi:transposase